MKYVLKSKLSEKRRKKEATLIFFIRTFFVLKLIFMESHIKNVLTNILQKFKNILVSQNEA